MTIQLGDDPISSLLSLAQGNPGAATVLGKLLQDGPQGYMDILHLDDMGMKGPQIWVAWKDYCKQDLEAFRKAIRARDPDYQPSRRRAAVSGPRRSSYRAWSLRSLS